MVNKNSKSRSYSVGKGNESSRIRWLEEILYNIPRNSRILDAGAGMQPYRKFCEHLDYVSQDFGEYDGKGDSVGLHGGNFNYGKIDIVSDIISIPEPDESFDAIMSIEVDMNMKAYRHAKRNLSAFSCLCAFCMA